jgi:carbonic anhydrase/acetyltransferase-like protein (isoleucine patch superfamily)
MSIRSFAGVTPTLGARVYVDSTAVVLGNVNLADDVSIWPHCAVRGDVHAISVGARSNIQDNSVLHVTHDGVYTPGGMPLIIGADVTVGHGVILHACTVGDCSLIGMGSVILDGAVVEAEAMIGAGSVVSPGKRVAARSLWLGNPARMVRVLSDREVDMLKYSANNYLKLKAQFIAEYGG